jgi:hypothetical protein
MKKLKCAMAVLIGTFLGLVAACSPKSRVPVESQPSSSVPEPSVTQTNVAPPAQTNSLPVRRPVYE